MEQVQKSQQDANWARLIGLMQDINFGRISGLQIQNGAPILTQETVVEREFKLAGLNAPRPEIDLDSFVLKQEVVALIKLLSPKVSVVVTHLEIKHGLPFLIRIQEQKA